MVRLRLTVHRNILLVKKIARALSDFDTKIIDDDISSRKRRSRDPIDRVGSIDSDKIQATFGRTLVMENASNLILSINIRSSSESYYVAL